MSKIVAALGRLFPFFSENSSNNTQNQRKIKDFSNNEIFSLCSYAYLYYGYSMFTGQLLFHGLYNNRLNDGLLLELANFTQSTTLQKRFLFIIVFTTGWIYLKKNFMIIL